ncbi:MAG: UDP-N-acetylmuramoyl-tripeptide--D-alanyl-D-alanine ligase [Planctomycetes bacterium]|nr:UDP-N-acetylmuramoyl-tripeptide--D-alanyl-D-alanine ligase [Planctomycetota bacterium]
MQIRWVAEAVQGELLCPPRGGERRALKHVRTDSREVEDSDLFVALRGDRFDGHDYVAESFRRGAGAVLVERSPSPDAIDAGTSGAFIRVKDTARALRDLGAAWRRAMPATVIGITGSCGKTSTKNILRHVLEGGLSTTASDRSFNNDIGVPLTLLKIEPSTQAAVVEIGTNGPGEIERLTRLAAPTIGVVTNVFETHLEGLGSLDGVANEKANLLRLLPKDGLAVLNRDCPRSAWLRSQTETRVVTVGLSDGADYRAEEVSFSALGTSFRFRGHAITIPLTGTHFVHNVLFAMAVAEHLGLELEAVAERLREIPITPRRMERKSFGSLEVIDDSYNASPASVRAALRAVKGLNGGRRSVIVLGDMLELGEQSAALHESLGAEVAAEGFDLVVTVGAHSRAIERAVVARGGAARHFEAVPELLANLGALVQPRDRVLVKGSNALGLDRVVRDLSQIGEQL